MGSHALHSPSGAEKWMTCAGAIAMEAGRPDSSSDYADEGTAAHFLGSTCLSNGQDPVYFLAKEIVVWAHAESDSEGCCFAEDLGTNPSLVVRNTFKVDADMCGHVRHYVKAVLAYAADGGQLFVEQRVPIDHLTGEADAGGTSDALIVRAAQDMLIVIDLKYGQGELVSPVGNKQLLMYASGALEWLSFTGVVPSKIKLVIHQPRIQQAPLEWDCTIEDVRAFEGAARDAARASQIALEFRSNWVGKDTSYLTVSDKGCRWCRAKGDCPARDAHVQSALEANFEKLSSTTVSPEKAVALMVHGSGEALSLKMKAVPLVEDWCKAVRAEVERNLLANHDSVPDFKIVQGKRGNRKWADEAEAEDTLKKMRVKHEHMYDYKLVSPTQAEKVFKEGGIGPKQWPRVQALITQSDGKPSVAPASDPRPALAPVADAFEVLPPDDGSDLI